MNPGMQQQALQTRRQFFGRSAVGIGTAAYASLLNRDATATPVNQNELPLGGLPHLPHYAAKAKRVIYMFMNGAPTHTDLFDYNPLQQKMHGEPIPESYFKGKRFSTMTGNPAGKKVLAPVEPFRRYGESGAWVSDFMKHTGKVADDVCFIKSMHTEQVNHAPAVTFFLSLSLIHI